MTTITSLPNEIIISILKCENIIIEDIVRFGATCTRFQELIQDKGLWREKYFDRRPWMEEDRNTEEWNNLTDFDFKEKLITIMKHIKNLQDYLFAIYENESLTTQRDIIKEFNRLLYSIAEDATIFGLIWNQLARIICRKWSRNFATMCAILFDCQFIELLIQYLQDDPSCIPLDSFINEPAQCYLPHVPYSIQNAWLDDIEQGILSRIKDKYPTYPIFWISSEKLSLLEETNINDTFWDETEIIQIVEILDEYIFSEVMLRKLEQLWQKLEPKTPLSGSTHIQDRLLYATYHTIASRLRIDCDPSVDLLDQFLKKKYKIF